MKPCRIHIEGITPETQPGSIVNCTVGGMEHAATCTERTARFITVEIANLHCRADGLFQRDLFSSTIERFYVNFDGTGDVSGEWSQIMDKKRIDEIHVLVGGAYPSHWYYDEARDLLDALEDAQAENGRLREALRSVESLGVVAADFPCQLKSEPLRGWYTCRCGAKFEYDDAGILRGEHADNCPFAVLSEGR